jgi:hypothetical protein
MQHLSLIVRADQVAQAALRGFQQIVGADIPAECVVFVDPEEKYFAQNQYFARISKQDERNTLTYSANKVL